MGLLNTPMNQGGGLLGNIPQGALLGAALYGQGIQGKDPLAGLFPAYMQTAQLQKLMTPNKTNLQKNIEALGYKPGTPEYEAALKKGLFKDDSSTTLSKNLELAGFVKGTPEFEDAMKLRTLPDGAVQYSKFGKAAKRDESLGHANFAKSGIDQLITIGEIAGESPRAFGTTGSVLSFGKDVATEVEGAYKGAINRALGEGIDSGVYEFLGDQNYAGIGPLENALSITIARNRNKSGRLLKDMIKDAKDDASLRGLGGSEKVRQKLPFIFKEFLDSAQSSYRLAGWTDNEIAKELNPKIKEFQKVMAKLSGMDISSGQTKTGGRIGKKTKNRKMKQNESGVWVFVEE